MSSVVVMEVLEALFCPQYYGKVHWLIVIQLIPENSWPFQKIYTDVLDFIKLFKKDFWTPIQTKIT